MNAELITAITAAAVSIIGAVALYIVSYFNNKRLKQRLQTIEEALTSEPGVRYYTICPNCKTKIYLDTVKILYDKQNTNT